MTDPYEQLLSLRVEAAAAADVYDFPIGEIVSSAIERGRRRRRHARLRRSASILASVAAVGAIAVSVAGAGSGWLENRDAAPAVMSTASAPLPTVTSASRVLAARLSAYGTATPVLHHSSAAVPPGAVTTAFAVRAVDGVATVAAVISTDQVPRAGEGAFGCPVGPGIVCSTELTTAGLELVAFNPSGSAGTSSMWQVALGRPDGRVVQVSEWNSDQPKGPTAEPMPLLSLAQLRSLAADPAW